MEIHSGRTTPLPRGLLLYRHIHGELDDEEELRVKERAVEKLSGTYGGKCLPGIVEEHYLNWPTRFAGWARPQVELSPPPLRVGRPYTFIMGELIYPTSRCQRFTSRPGKSVKSTGSGIRSPAGFRRLSHETTGYVFPNVGLY